MKRALATIVVMLFLAGIFIVPAGVNLTPARLQETSLGNVTLEQESELAWLPADKTIRVAIYNETNSTTPTYTAGTMNTNYTFIFDVLVNAGYQVTRLTFQDILDHDLTTGNFDVLVLADNCPRENITDYVREFWLGGGGVLSFDSSAGYLGYAGILPREDLGVDDGLNTYWRYIWNDVANVSTRHPVTKSHALGEQLTLDNYYNYAHYNWTALMTSSIASSLTRLAYDDDDMIWAQAVAMDPTDMGGRVVHLGVPIDPWPSAWENVMVDAIDWLCPRPKGRILFDLTHDALLGVDAWEGDVIGTPEYYIAWRNALVNRSYTFDKLWPSAAGNLTIENLQGYDMLITVLPGKNFTAAEVSAVTSWVQAGGSLLVLGNTLSSLAQGQNINYLLNAYSMEWNSTDDAAGAANDFATHPISEGLSLVTTASVGIVNIQSPAYPIVTTSNGDVIAGAQEYGEGRVVFVSDLNIFDKTRILLDDNLQLAINLANWLISASADVIVYTDEPDSSNYYRTPVVNALNELGIDFYLVHLDDYLNLSLHLKTWGMVIVDNPWDLMSNAIDAIYDHVESGGRFLMSGYRVDNAPDRPLWALLGFQYIQDMPDEVPLFIWDTGHPIFNMPNDYSETNFTTTRDYGDEGDILGVFPNATAIAGNSSSYNVNHSVIVLGNDGRTLYNGYIIDQFQGDLDDSTYPDNYELWENQIAFMMRVTVDSPSDIEYELGDTGNDLTWVGVSDRPFEYEVTLDTVQVEYDTWDGSNLLITVDGLTVGVYSFEITVWDTAGYSAIDEVIVTVVDTTAPEWTEIPANFALDYDAIWHYDVNATDLSGISTYFMNDTTNFDIDSTGLLTNNTFLHAGVYGLNISVEDNHGNVLSKVINITVSEEVIPTTTTTTTTTPTTTPTTTDTTTPPPGDTGILIIVIAVAAAGALIVIIIIIMMKKKS